MRKNFYKEKSIEPVNKEKITIKDEKEEEQKRMEPVPINSVKKRGVSAFLKKIVQPTVNAPH